QNKSVVSQVKSCDANSNSSSEIAKLTHAVNQQTSAMTTAMTTILKQFQATPPPASIKAIEEIYVTYGGAQPYYQCLAAGGNTFPELRDNIQGYVSAAVVNYNQGNSVYRPTGMANQIRPPGFAQPNVQNNQNWFSQPQGYNRGNNFNHEQSYQAPTQQNQASLSNQTNEIKNMMAGLFQMNTASTSWSGSLPSNTVANPNGELKAITTRSSIVLDGPFVPTPPPFINPEVDECVEETLMDQDLAEYTIKVPPPPVQKYKPPSQRDFVVYQRDPLHLNIPYPSRMLKQKQQEKYEVQIHKFWQMFKQLHINITLADALILMPKYQKMLKALLSNKEKLQELANTPLNENCSAVILKKLPEKLRDPGKFTFLADFVIVDYESDPRVPLILGRPFLRTARAMIDVHGEEMILRDEFLEDLFSTNQPSGNPTFSSHPELTSLEVKDDIFDPEGGNVLLEKLLDLDFTKDLLSLLYVNPLSGSTTYSSSPNQLLEEFADELALITFPPKYDDDLQFDIEFDLKEIEYLLYHDPIKDIDSSLKDSIDQSNLFDLNDNLVDSITEMFIDEHALDYSSHPLFDEYDDDLFEVESGTKNVYDDPFDSKGEKIKESKLLIDELDLPCEFLPSSEYDSFLSKDFSKVDAFPSTNNEDKVFNPGILIQENLFEIITRVVQDKKLAISHASLMIEDVDPLLYELPFFKEVPRETCFSFVVFRGFVCPDIPGI
nr:reverse transcriptase domain-containing protein [Tanacetum cinerariifolium]